MDDRLYPARPLLGVSAAIWQDGRVLIAQRGKPPLRGIWSLPGGLVEIGETLAEAAAREIMEETAIEAEILGLLDSVEVVHRDVEGRVRTHFTILVHVGRYLSGTPVAGDDAIGAQWIDPDDLGSLSFTDRTPDMIRRSADFLNRVTTA